MDRKIQHYNSSLLFNNGNLIEHDEEEYNIEGDKETMLYYLNMIIYYMYIMFALFYIVFV